MHIGVCIFATEYAIRIDELAREAEARNFESLWVPEHTHIPTSRRSPFAGGQLPEQYKHTLDPFVALTAAAAATEKLRVGTGICLIIERDTITTAKSVATLDLLSNGRFELGIGGGWNAEEMEHHGTIVKSRFQRMREQVLALKERSTAATSSPSSRAGRGPSRSRSHTRPCCWAVRAATRSSAWSISAMAGSPARATRSASCRAWPS